MRKSLTSALTTTALILALGVPLTAHAQDAAPAGAPAQAAPTEFTPEVGQAGKDVIWVPTPQVLVDRMLEMAKATPDDYLIDLGSGDGITVITAAKKGIKAHGIEYNPDMVALAKKRAEAEGVADRATFEQADIFETDFSDADVLTLFLLPSLNERLMPTILDMEPGTRIVSNSFGMGDWQADETAILTEEGCTSWCTALLWIVPAKVDGAWQLGDQELTLKQTYQTFEGTLGGEPVTGGKLNGANISFVAGSTTYTGTVEGDRIAGKAEGGSAADWTATRAK